MKLNFRTIFAALFAMMLMVFAMPQKAQAATGMTVKVSQTGAPWQNGSSPNDHNVTNISFYKGLSATTTFTFSYKYEDNAWYIYVSYNGTSERISNAHINNRNMEGVTFSKTVAPGATTTVGYYGNGQYLYADISYVVQGTTNVVGTYDYKYTSIKSKNFALTETDDQISSNVPKGYVLVPNQSTTINPDGKTLNPSAITFYVVADIPATTFTLNFNGNAEGASNVPGSLTATEKETSHDFTIPENIPVLDGYIFKGWAESNTATEATVQPKDKYTVLSSAATKTLYAVWEKIKLGNLTISCEGLQNEESAVIEVKNGNSVLYRVSVSSDSPSVTIKGISVGTYTVAPMDWSWTYETMDSKSVTIEEEQTASVSFTAVKKTSIEPKYDENKKVVK